MIDIKNPKCITCKVKQPNFNILGEKTALYCSGCALPNMIDIKNPKCALCKKSASYGQPGSAPSHCVTHKQEGMTSKPRAKCKKHNCNALAIYGQRSPIHCEQHKDGNDINLVEQICAKCGLLDVLFDGLCINVCSTSEHVTNEMKKRQKVKEKRILRILESEYKKPDEYNKKVAFICGQRHSEEKEFGYDHGTHKVYVEVDENQHKSYCEQGEINRMKNIYMDDGGVPVLFLRYNPDNYTVNRKKQTIPQGKREVELIKWLKFYENFDNLKENHLSVQYLYYSDGDNMKLHKIDPYEHV